MVKRKYVSDQAGLYESVGNWWELLEGEESDLSLQPLWRVAGFLTRRAWPGLVGEATVILPEQPCRLHLTLARITGIMHLTSPISNLKQRRMCCGLYFRLLLKCLLALSPAYFCSAWAPCPTLVPKTGVINQDGGGTVKTPQEGRFPAGELPRGLHRLW